MTQQSGRIWVMGGRPLNGTAAIPAAKNSVLPLLAAALLCRGPVRLRAVPRLSDVECSLGLLRGAGCAAYWQGADIVVAGMPSNSTLPGETAAQMRASILFCAPLLARLGRAETSLPGGCNIGARPIDLHLEGLARMGAKELDAGAGKLVLAAPGGLHGADITLRFPSVGATETLLLAAVCARGTTVLRGAAREPEISDLTEFLNRCGGRIEGAGTSTLRIEGRGGLSGCDFSPLPDRIFASTLACAAAAAGGRRVFQKHLHQTGKNDPGQEIRQIGRRLHAAFDLFQAQLIEHECEENRERRLEYDVIAVDDQRVFCRAPEIGVGDHLAEMLKTDPRRAPDAEICVIVLKGQLNAVHGAVIEHDHKDKARQDKQI